MKFDDIQTEFKYTAEHLCTAHSYLSELITEVNKFIFEYSKSKNYNKNFYLKLENNLLYLENFYEKLDYIIEELEHVDLYIIKKPKAEIKKIYDYMKIPDNYDIDIYIDLFQPINWDNDNM